MNSLPQPRPHVTATEGWAPNIPVATANLAPYGIEVVTYDAETDEALAAPDDSFDVIMSRHESMDAAEVARLLAPSGVFLTQQVDGNELPELRELFGGEPTYPDVTLAIMRQQLEDAGLTVTFAEEWAGKLAFESPEALDEYLTLVPWDRPDAFDASHLPPGLITLTQKRFVIVANQNRLGIVN